MALILRVPLPFLHSDSLPPVCLFSGRTDQVESRPLAVDYVHWAIKLITLILLFTLVGWLAAAIIYSLARYTIVLNLPQVRWEKLKWNLLRALPLPGLLLPVVAGCLIGAGISHGHDWIVAVGFGIGFVLGLSAGAGLMIWVFRHTVHLSAVDPQTIQIRFPERLRPVYDQYQAAFDTWQAEHRVVSGRRVGREAEAAQAADDGEWAEQRTADWDQSKSAGPSGADRHADREET